MSGKDIDMYDDYELVAFYCKETEVLCSTISSCSVCPCVYNDPDDIYLCRKEHLIKRKEELLPFFNTINLG